MRHQRRGRTAGAGEMGNLSPRIYDLHPLLAGTITRWREHLPRIAGMGFDWVYVNAFWTPGASGSIYAIRDPFELHPLVRGEAREPAHELTGRFIKAARESGLKVMLDLVAAARGARFRAGARASRVVPLARRRARHPDPGQPHRPAPAAGDVRPGRARPRQCERAPLADGVLRQARRPLSGAGRHRLPLQCRLQGPAGPVARALRHLARALS